MNFLEKIPADRHLHFEAGLILSQLATYLMDSPVEKILIGLGVGVSAAILKELYDKLIKKTFIDYKDIIATVCGSIIGTALVAFI